jgi:hypothetical protein
MRIALDPIPLVLGIYAHVGEVLNQTASKREAEGAEALGRRLSRSGGSTAADRDVQKMVRTLHTDVKVADKLLKKTGDVWKISQETDLVDLVITPRGEGEGPKAYVLLKPREIRPLLESIRSAAQGAGESETVISQLTEAASSMDPKSGDYYAFGFDPWEG